MGDQRRRGYLAALDGLRGVAVAAVVAYHLWPTRVPGGYLGVSVFFTLSGYLITSRLLIEFLRTGTISLRGFYDRRIRRLVPAASVVIVVTALVVLLADRPEVLTAGDVRAAAFWHYNWHELARDFQYGGTAPSALGHYWSLSIEEQYYFVFPVLVAVTLRWWGWQGLRWVVSTLAVMAFVAAWRLDSYFNTFGRLWEILAGALLAVIGWKVTATRTAVVFNAVGLATLVVLFAQATLPPGGRLPNAAIAITTAATIAVVMSATLPRNPFSLAPLVMLGRYSYSIYLVHWPVLVFVDGLAARLVLTAVLSAASYHLVERPIRYATEPFAEGVTNDAALHGPQHHVAADAGTGSVRVHA